MREIGIELETKSIRVKDGGRAIIGLQDLVQKAKVMKEKGRMREKGIRLEDDLTWKKRKMKWKLEGIARRERAEGKRVWVRYGRIQIEGEW